MQKKLQREKAKGKYKSKDLSQRLRKDYSTKESIEELKSKMFKIATEERVTTTTRLALRLDYTPDELYHLVADHSELKDFFEKIKLIIGMNAYDLIESREIAGLFSKFSVTKYVKEIRDEIDRIKEEDHKRAIERSQAKELQNNGDAKVIYRVINENIREETPE